MALSRRPAAVIRTVVWAFRAVPAVQRALARRRFTAGDVPIPPSAPEGAEIALNAVLRVRRAKCLTRSIVRQQWLAAQGDLRELVIGVTGSHPEFRAHAWLVGDPAWTASGYTEILRRGPLDPLVPPADESAFD
jgi:hypothetical protein